MEGRWSEFNGGRHETTSLSRGREKIGGEGGKDGGMVEQVVEEVLEGISLWSFFFIFFFFREEKFRLGKALSLLEGALLSLSLFQIFLSN